MLLRRLPGGERAEVAALAGLIVSDLLFKFNWGYPWWSPLVDLVFIVLSIMIFLLRKLPSVAWLTGFFDNIARCAILRSAPRLRRGALLIGGAACILVFMGPGSAEQRQLALHRVRDTVQMKNGAHGPVRTHAKARNLT